MYVEQGRVTTSTTLAFTLATTTTGATFNIKVSMIECSNPSRAPTDCIQYLTGYSNTIKSFNWDGKVQIAGTALTYCIRRENGMCAIQYIPVQGQTIGSLTIFCKELYFVFFDSLSCNLLYFRHISD